MARGKRDDGRASLERDLASGALRPVYLLYGREPFLAQQLRARLEQAVLAGGVGGTFNREVLIGARATPDQVTEAVRTMPMLGGRRLVVVTGIDEGDARRHVQPLHEALAEVVAAEVETAVLLLTAAQLDGRRKLFKAIQKHGLAVECRPLWDRALERWVGDEAERLGRPIDRRAVALLLDMVGNDLGKLHNELQKLVDYVGERPRIELRDAEEAVADLLLSTVYDLTEALGHARLDGALLALRNLHDSKTAEQKTLWFITDHFRKLLLAREAVDGGTEPEQACVQAGVRKNMAWKVKRQLSSRTTAQLRRALVRIAETDDALRRSRVAPHLQLDRLAIDLCREARPAGRGY